MYLAYKVQIPLISTPSNLTPVILLYLLCVCSTAMVSSCGSNHVCRVLAYSPPQFGQ